MEEEKKYTMAELLAEEDKRLKNEAIAAEKQRKEAEEQRRLDREKYLADLKAQKEADAEKRHQEWLAEKERRENTFEDKNLTCKKCGKEFLFSASEQKFFKEKGFFRPSMCKECKASIKTINHFHKTDDANK